MRAMTRPRLVLLALLVSLGAGSMVLGRTPAPRAQGSSATRPPGTAYKGRAFTFNKIADGVYHAVGTGSLVVMSNAVVIEGDRDVLVVDSHVSPGGLIVGMAVAERHHLPPGSFRVPDSLDGMSRALVLRFA